MYAKISWFEYNQFCVNVAALVYLVIVTECWVSWLAKSGCPALRKDVRDKLTQSQPTTFGKYTTTL